MDVTQFGNIIKGPQYKMFFIEFPVKGNDSLVSEGEWQMVVSGLSSSEYWAYGMVDDHQLDYKSTFGIADDRVGNPLPLSVQIDYNGIPAVDSFQVQAVVLKPNQDFGTLFSSSTAPNTVPTETGLTAGQQKFEQLLNDPNFANKLIPKELTGITLSHQGNGKYSATFNDTKESGPYQVVYLITGEKKAAGTFSRVETVSTIVQFVHVDANESLKSYSFLSNVWQFTVQPKNIYGNLLGPEYIHGINVVTSAGIVSNVKDNLNGSYTYTLSGVPAGIVPKINIIVLGESF